MLKQARKTMTDNDVLFDGNVDVSEVSAICDDIANPQNRILDQVNEFQLSGISKSVFSAP